MEEVKSEVAHSFGLVRTTLMTILNQTDKIMASLQ